MSKNNKVSSKYQEFVDDYEDFGYAVQNQKRYSNRSKKTAKFKDYDEYEDYRS